MPTPISTGIASSSNLIVPTEQNMQINRVPFDVRLSSLFSNFVFYAVVLGTTDC